MMSETDQAITKINMQQWLNSNMALEGMLQLAPSYINPFDKQIPSDMDTSQMSGNIISSNRSWKS